MMLYKESLTQGIQVGLIMHVFECMHEYAHVCIKYVCVCRLKIHQQLRYFYKSVNTVEPPKTDSPYYGNLHNADKSPRSRIV